MLWMDEIVIVNVFQKTVDLYSTVIEEKNLFAIDKEMLGGTVK